MKLHNPYLKGRKERKDEKRFYIAQSDLVDYVWERTEDKITKLKKSDVRLIVDYFLLGMKRSLVQNYGIKLVNFGSFIIRTCKTQRRTGLFPNQTTAQHSKDYYGKLVFKPCEKIKGLVRVIDNYDLWESDEYLELEDTSKKSKKSQIT